ncbi:hypothetical protein [Cupriavidus lacunae]|uniref:hypothetical protein n=1 Tax=Cupriavidus lacunae TaxID=2666307 RepID=UPI0010589C06|nr:hypothetical protein [Cupriavidus lacunae]
MTDLFEHQLIAMLERGLVVFVEILPASEGWYVRINGYHWLRSRRQCPHLFTRGPEKLMYYLRDLGCMRVTVDLTVWPETKSL